MGKDDSKSETGSVSSWPTFSGDPAKRKIAKRKNLGKKKAQHLSHKKKSERGKDLGGLMEERVEKLGLILVERGDLSEFVRHEPNSKEDSAGKDFTATKIINGELVQRSFGITISGEKKRIVSQSLHLDVPQWWTPWEMRDENIQKKIVSLFVDPK